MVISRKKNVKRIQGYHTEAFVFIVVVLLFIFMFFILENNFSENFVGKITESNNFHLIGETKIIGNANAVRSQCPGPTLYVKTDSGRELTRMLFSIEEGMQAFPRYFNIPERENISNLVFEYGKECCLGSRDSCSLGKTSLHISQVYLYGREYNINQILSREGEKFFIPYENIKASNENKYRPAWKAIDGDNSTYYMACSSAGQSFNKGWILWDMGVVKKFNRLDILYGRWYDQDYPSNAPCNYNISISNDKINWENIYNRGGNCGLNNVNSLNIPDLNLNFSNVKQARYLKLDHTIIGKGNGECLSIREMSVSVK